MGGRSAKAVNFLRRSGFKKVYNLTGGITAWPKKSTPKCQSTKVSFHPSVVSSPYTARQPRQAP